MKLTRLNHRETTDANLLVVGRLRGYILPSICPVTRLFFGPITLIALYVSDDPVNVLSHRCMYVLLPDRGV